MSKADVSAGRAFVTLFMKNDLSKPLKNAQKELSEFGANILGIGSKAAGMGAAVVGGLAAAVVGFANVGSELNDMSARTGLSTDALVELGYAAQMTGSDIETLESGVKKMQKNLGGIGPESGKAISALGAMGLKIDDLNRLSPEDQFQAIAESIGSIEDPSQKAAAAMAIFGGSGTDLLPMMENIKELRKEAKELGIAPSPESIAAADMLGDTIDKMKKVVGSAFFEIGAAVAPMAQDILDGFILAAKAVRKFVAENKPLIVTAAKVAIAITAAGAAIMAVGVAFIAAGAVIGGVLSVTSGVAAAFGVITAVLSAVLSPLGLLIAALTGGAVAWVKFTDSGKQTVAGFTGFITSAFTAISTTVIDTFGGIVDAIRGGDLELAGQIAMTGLRLVFMQALEGIQALFGDTIGTITAQLTSGDFSGAWATVGSSILDSVALVTQGIVKLFTGAADAVMEKWQKTVNAISDLILEASTQGGAMGWAMEQISGVDMQAEKARGDKIEAARRARGMTPDNGSGLTKSDEYQNPALAAMKEAVRAAGQSANEAMQGATDATGQALSEKTGGAATQASSAVTKLQEELAALRQKASAGVQAVGGTSSMDGSASGGRMSSMDVGKASAATFSAASLLSMGGAGGNSQLKATMDTKKAIEDQSKQQKELHASTIEALGKLGLHHA